MRLAIVIGAICALTRAASAEIGDCSAIADAAAQLACYNKEPSPAAPRSSAARHPKLVKPPTAAADSSSRIEQPTDEDAAVDAKMRSLCRGC